MTTKDKGDQLEKRVERLFKKLGKWNVQRNVTLIDKHGNRSQIDVMYGLFFRRYIECKNYSRDHMVPLEDVAKFKEVLSLNGIWKIQGLFVTTSNYVPRARTTGIKTVNGRQLRMLEYRASLYSMWRRLAYLGVVGLITWEALHFGTPDSLFSPTTQRRIKTEWDKQMVEAKKHYMNFLRQLRDWLGW